MWTSRIACTTTTRASSTKSVKTRPSIKRQERRRQVCRVIFAHCRDETIVPSQGTRPTPNHQGKWIVIDSSNNTTTQVGAQDYWIRPKEIGQCASGSVVDPGKTFALISRWWIEKARQAEKLFKGFLQYKVRLNAHWLEESALVILPCPFVLQRVTLIVNDSIFMKISSSHFRPLC